MYPLCIHWMILDEVKNIHGVTMDEAKGRWEWLTGLFLVAGVFRPNVFFLSHVWNRTNN